VQVGVRVLGHVIVEHNVDTLDVHAAAKQVRRHQDTLLEVLELLVTVQAVHTDVREYKYFHTKYKPALIRTVSYNFQEISRIVFFKFQKIFLRDKPQNIKMHAKFVISYFFCVLVDIYWAGLLTRDHSDPVYPTTFPRYSVLKIA